MDKLFATKMVGANPEEKRSAVDFYPTPPEATEALLRFLHLPKETVIWEPACGEMDMASAIQRAGYSVIATDLIYGQNFLTEPLHDCDWIITNPPFTIADKFIERCTEHGKPFAMLLKSHYWHARKRYDLFTKVTPTFVCPLTWRPNFMFKKREKRSSPLMDMMWCVWEPPYDQKTVYHLLNK